MKEQRSKSNKKFMVLSAIGIFMVVDSHTFTTFHFFGDFIPYNSFFMPMFVFISGYFNKVDSNTKLPAYVWKKVKTLLVPFLGLSCFVFLIQQLMDWYKLGERPAIASWYLSYTLERVLTIGAFAPIAEPTWFVLTLFTVLILYAVIKKFLARFWNSYVALGIFICLHLLSVYLAKNILPTASPYFLLPVKCMFFLPFLELGILYRERLEKKHESLSGGWKIALLFALLLINMIRTVYLPAPYDVAFDSLDDLSGFTSPYLITPLVSSLVGILFWLTMVELLGKPVYESKFVNFMSCNTFWIMALQIMFFNLLNCVLMFISMHLIELPYFDVEAFQGSEWYFWEWSLNLKLLYVVAGILGPLGVKAIWDKIRAFVGGKLTRDKKGE